MPENKKEQVLSVRDLDITFKTTAGPVHAIRGVNIDLYKGETVALVGESGSGKSVTMKAAMGILAQNAIVNSGSIQFSYHHADGSPETVDLLQSHYPAAAEGLRRRAWRYNTAVQRARELERQGLVLSLIHISSAAPSTRRSSCSGNWRASTSSSANAVVWADPV